MCSWLFESIFFLKKIGDTDDLFGPPPRPHIRGSGSNLLLAQLTKRLTKLLHGERSSIKLRILFGKH